MNSFLDLGAVQSNGNGGFNIGSIQKQFVTPAHTGRGDITGKSKRPQTKGLMKAMRGVPFRTFAYDNSQIYRKR